MLGRIVKNMYRGKKITVIVPAAGSGRRMGGTVNKVYMDILGRTVLRRTLEAFEGVSAVDEIVVAVRSDEIELCKAVVIGDAYLSKPIRIVEGGAERYDTVLKCLETVDRDSIVMIHDGARPLIEKDTIEAAIEATYEHSCCCVAVPAKDTTKIVRDGFVVETPDRATVWSVQTPQGFYCGEIEEIIKKWLNNGFKGTDEASFAEKEGKKVFIVEGKYANIKITTSDDISIAEAILMKRNK